MVHEDRPLSGQTEGTESVHIRTFLIADVRGYTLFTQERGDEVAAKLAARFAEITREIVETRGGTLLELRGDEALCVFSSTREAIRAAVDLQQRFVEETLEQPELPLTVGIGLDAGEAVPVQGGYRGGALNLAARLCGQARAGEILGSREVTHLARAVDGVRYEDRGALSLKGLSEPVSVVRIVPTDADPAERLKPFAAKPPPAARRSRRWIPAAAAVVALALVVIAIPLLRSDAGPIDLGSNSVARLNTDGGLELETALKDRPGASAVGFGSLWVTQPDRGVVVRLDLEDGSITDTIQVGSVPSAVAVGEGAVWVTNEGDGTISRIDPDSNEQSAVLQAGSAPSGIAVGDGSLWVADSVGVSLYRIDPISGDTQSVPLSGLPNSVSFTPEGVWVSTSPSGAARIDGSNPDLTLEADVGGGPTAVLYAFGSIWVANHLDGSVTRVRASTGGVEATIPTRDGAGSLAAAGGRVWVGNELDDSLSVIDPSTNAVERTISVGAGASSLAASGDGIWVAVGASASEHRGGTLDVSSETEMPTSIDPALTYDLIGWQILTITNDGLVGYRKVGGGAGATLVPDLAAALPEVSDDGLTYRFALRTGMRYSTGDPVRPEDFRRGLERAIGLSPDAASLFSALEGAGACHEHASACDLADAITVDDGSVTYHLARPDADIPFLLGLPFAYPVPVDTPAEDQGLTPVPATGPYMVTLAANDTIELRRNPAFEEWSGAAQPDGFVNAITLRFGIDVGTGFDRVTAGDGDLMLDTPAPDDLAVLRATHPDQAIRAPDALTLFVGLDVARPPFDHERVRQAFSLALDRSKIVDLFGEETAAACQILPPNFPGYVPFCPFTLEPERGTWSAPDPDRAEALMEASGTMGDPVSVTVTDRVGYLPAGATEVMRYVTKVLNDLGLRAHLKVVHNPNTYFDAVYRTPAGSPDHAQVFMSGWGPDYPGASAFIAAQFACDASANAFGFCDEKLDVRMKDAQALQLSDPGTANREWADIEHELVTAAPQVPIANRITTLAVSDRTGNVQINPQWGVLLSRLWVQ
jgi:peptide/nickel transport system substrate-binding protein